MRSASDDSVIVEHLPQLFRGAAMVACKFDTLVADLGNCREHARQIGFALVAQRIELQPNRNFPGMCSQTVLGRSQGQSRASGGD